MTNNKQQTAVDYIFSQLPAEYGTTRSAFDVYQQAKEMEKEQIIEAFDFGDYCIDLPEGGWKQKYDSPEQYYKQTYGGGEQ
jgi:hypothetical protein